MCELVLQLVDKPLTGDLALDSQRLRRGDVIAALSDGHLWTPRELTNPDWLILKVPGMSVEEGEAHTVGEPDDRTGRRFRWKRFFHLNLGDDVRFVFPRTAAVVSMTKTKVRKLKKRKRPHPDPNVIG